MAWVFKILELFLPRNYQEFVGFGLGLLSLLIYFLFLENAVFKILSQFLPVTLINNGIFNIAVVLVIMVSISYVLSYLWGRFFDRKERCWRAFDRGDFETIIKLATPLATKGDADMQWLVGLAYDRDEYASCDPKRAVTWLGLAGEQGHEFAQLLLGEIYDDGRDGISPNYDLSVKWYERASRGGLCTENGSKLAQLLLGLKKLNADGAPRDIKGAVRSFKLSAEQGNLQSMGILSALYFDGDFLPQNFQESLRYAKLVIDQGALNGFAEALVGQIYENGLGVPVDYQEAFKWYKLGVEKGDDDAMNFLGVMYCFGYGIAKNEEEARRLFKTAAALGNQDAAMNLDNIGDKNETENYSNALKGQFQKTLNKVEIKTNLTSNVVRFPDRK